MKIVKEMGKQPDVFVPYKIILEVNDSRTQSKLLTMLYTGHDLIKDSLPVHSHSKDLRISALDLMTNLMALLRNRDPATLDVIL